MEELEPIFAPAGSQAVKSSQENSGTIQPAGQSETESGRQPVKRLIRKQGSGYTPSIKDAISGKYAAETHSGGDAKEKLRFYAGEEMHQPFTKDEFEVKWLEYLDHLHDRPNLKATLSRIPEITEGFQLKLKIENSVQNEEIGKIKPDLVSWLRRELKNTNIELITEIVITEIEAKPYSETEKLAEMVKRNPNISLLRQKFNLDFGEI